jgi:hypothetical protein
MKRALVAVLLLFWCVGSSSGQSLGRVAVKEKERRQQNAVNGVSARSFASTGETIAEEDGDRGSVKDSESDERSPSLLEAERERAAILEPRMAEIARTADELDVLYERYLNQCYGRHTITTTPGPATTTGSLSSYNVLTGRGWFLVLENPSALTTVEPGPGRKTVTTAQTPACQKLASDLVASATEVKTAMEGLLEDARKKGILPGMVRELREKYNLEWSRYRL